MAALDFDTNLNFSEALDIKDLEDFAAEDRSSWDGIGEYLPLDTVADPVEGVDDASYWDWVG